MKPSLHWLFAFIPISVGVERAHVPAPLLFFSAALAIVPIAALIVQATEQIATRTGDAVGRSAIAMARKNKVDLTMGIAMGSSIQIALFVAPVLVLVSYFIAPSPLELSFSRAEIGTLFLGVLIGAIVAGDGRSNWFKGVQLVTVYAMIAILFYFLPAAK
jgi:Ca2+/H+ antiporter